MFEKKSIKRWIDIFLLAMIAFLFCLIIDSSIKKIGNSVASFSLKWGLIVSILFLMLMIMAIWTFLWQLGSTQFGLWPNFSFGTFVRWPSIWLSIVLALFCLSFLPQYTLQDILITDGIFSLGLFMGFLGRNMPYWVSVNKNNKHPSQTAKSFHEISNNQQYLIEWIHKEQAILEPDQDSFDMAHQARNIARALLEKPLKTVALVGEYGSGKSSIINMVGYYLNQQNRWRLNQTNRNSRNDLLHPIDVINCTISGWGLAKGSAAEHIWKEL